MTGRIKLNYFDLIELILSTLIAFFLIIDQKVIVYLITAIGLNAVISFFKFGVNKLKFHFLPFAGLLVLYVLGLLFTSDLSEGWVDLETKMSFLILPLFYGLRKREKAINSSIIIWALVLGLLCFIFYCYYQATLCYEGQRNRFCFENIKLSQGVHPTYVALYIIGAMSMVIVDLKKSKALFKLKIIGAILILPLFMYFVYRLYSIGPWVGLIAVLSSTLFLFFYQIKKIWIFFASGILILGVCYLLVSNLDLLESDYKAIKVEVASYFEDEDLYLEQNQNNLNSVSARIVLWNTAADFIGENPMGVGTGDSNQELYDFYTSKGMQAYAERQLNPHSQFLQTGIALGIIGSLYLLFAFGYYTRLAFKHRHYGLMVLVSLFGSICLVESLFERQLGILFFMFFLMIFVVEIDKNLSQPEIADQ
jgi:O-antigen ligase